MWMLKYHSNKEVSGSVSKNVREERKIIFYYLEKVKRKIIMTFLT